MSNPKIKNKKIISLILFYVSVISIILLMAALQDIFHNKEPQHSLTGEWLVVRYGVLAIIFFHIWIGVFLHKSFKKNKRDKD